MNSQFAYFTNIYPNYAASLFAANAAARSFLADGAFLFTRPLFKSLDVNGGVSLSAGVMCVCSVHLFGLYRYSPVLRAKSRFVGLMTH
ncbi:hypothetical protein LSUB1_G004530 [Lachnellula subtilissima]|uniref:Uncharacterized protein n=1 Tax=Lachnellula subtilissima TaxID=602034 RepID=A0A8H8U9I2_9HELO|nr:hypothetical protein LSUB1_G004530 [Lachnellula subtilissima]